MNLIYGAGTIGKKFISKLLENGYEDFLIVDSNSDKQGKSLYGKKVISPKEIISLDFEKIIITTDARNFNEIKDYLVNEMGINNKDIYWYNDVFSMDLNFGNIELKTNNYFLNYQEFTENIDREKLNKLQEFFFFGTHKIINKPIHYLEAYDDMFHEYIGKDLRILEIGVYKGGSLQMWKNYFKDGNNNVQIYGIDIDKECKKHEDEDIKIYIGSQEDRLFLNSIKKEIGQVDIVIDDGGHTMNQQKIAFEELYDIVSPGGIYLCEDVCTSYWKEYGGGYKNENSFLEQSKKLLDSLNAFNSECNELICDKYSKTIKNITYYDSMIFVKKKHNSRGMLVMEF